MSYSDPQTCTVPENVPATVPDEQEPSPVERKSKCSDRGRIPGRGTSPSPERLSSRHGKYQFRDGYTLWIGNISKKAGRTDVSRLLSGFGEISNLYVLTQSRNNYDCAFVDFASPDEVMAIGKAAWCHKLTIFGKVVTVTLRESTS